jgi:hypothetical protein
VARILHVRKTEIQSWIERGWPEATVRVLGKRSSYVITPEVFCVLCSRHLSDLLAQKKIPNVALFEAFYNFCFVPKNTIGAQLRTVRRDKGERKACAASQSEDDGLEEEVSVD